MESGVAGDVDAAGEVLGVGIELLNILEGILEIS